MPVYLQFFTQVNGFIVIIPYSLELVLPSLALHLDADLVRAVTHDRVQHAASVILAGKLAFVGRIDRPIGLEDWLSPSMAKAVLKRLGTPRAGSRPDRTGPRRISRTARDCPPPQAGARPEGSCGLSLALGIR